MQELRGTGWARIVHPLILGLVVTVGQLMLWPAPGSAGNDTYPSDTVEITQPESDLIGVRVTSGGRSSQAPSVCRWRRADSDPFGRNDGHSGGSDYFGTRALLYERYACDDPNRNGFVWIPQIDVQADLIPLLTEYVEARLPKPEAELQPKHPEHGWVYVQVPIDFRTSAASWTPVQASASVGGPTPVYATVTATPSDLEFVPGEPASTSVRCRGLEAIAAFVAEQPGACSYTYRNSSSIAANGESFAAQLRIHWDVRFVSSDGPGSILMAPTVTEFVIPVAEVQAVIECAGDSIVCADRGRSETG